MDEQERNDLLADVAQVVANFDELLTMPYVTDVYRASAR
jgi:hypothetical protein